MITKFNKYKKLNEINESDIYDLFHKQEIRDVDYYMNLIESGKISDYNISMLFHWSSIYDFHELTSKLIDYLNVEQLRKNERSLTYLNFNLFKKVINKIGFNGFGGDFIEYVFNNSKDKVKKLKFLKEKGINFNDSDLKNACYHGDKKGMLSVVKYFISLGFDPEKRIEATFSHQPENCLDISTKYNETQQIIKYLVEEENIPVTYRHMANVISKNNIEALKILINSENKIEDYSYSTWATHTEDKYTYTLSNLIQKLLNNNLTEYIKDVMGDNHTRNYNDLQSLPSSNNNKDSINKKLLNLAYNIIKNYNKTYYNSYTTKYITSGYDNFWLDKMKKDPSIIKKLLDVDFKYLYDYQKIILDADKKNLKYIRDILNDKIKKEYSYLIDSDKFNL